MGAHWNHTHCALTRTLGQLQHPSQVVLPCDLNGAKRLSDPKVCIPENSSGPKTGRRHGLAMFDQLSMLIASRLAFPDSAYCFFSADHRCGQSDFSSQTIHLQKLPEADNLPTSGRHQRRRL
jgi:hypothetical protein